MSVTGEKKFAVYYVEFVPIHYRSDNAVSAVPMGGCMSSNETNARGTHIFRHSCIVPCHQSLS